MIKKMQDWTRDDYLIVRKVYKGKMILLVVDKYTQSCAIVIRPKYKDFLVDIRTKILDLKCSEIEMLNDARSDNWYELEKYYPLTNVL